jgi:hypothetical protein
MAVKITESADGHMIDYGDNVRIERRAFALKRAPVIDTKTGKPRMTPTGQAITTHVPFHGVHKRDAKGPMHDKDGKPIFEVPADKLDAEPVFLWTLYQRVENAPAPDSNVRVHAHHGAETTETHTWLFVKDGTKEEMQAEAAKLAASL